MRITATSLLYSWGAQWTSALTYLSQEVWAYYLAKFPTYFFELLKRNIPQGMNEGPTVSVVVFQNATSSVGKIFLTRSGQCSVTLRRQLFFKKILWLTYISIYISIYLNKHFWFRLLRHTNLTLSLLTCTFLHSFSFASWLMKLLWYQHWESKTCWLKHRIQTGSSDYTPSSALICSIIFGK